MSKGADQKRVQGEVCTYHGALFIPLTCCIDHRRCCFRNEDDTRECWFIRESWGRRSLALVVFVGKYPRLIRMYSSFIIPAVSSTLRRPYRHCRFRDKEVSREEGEVCKEDEVFMGSYLPALICRTLATQGHGSGSSLQVFSDTSPLVRRLSGERRWCRRRSSIGLVTTKRKVRIR